MRENYTSKDGTIRAGLLIGSLAAVVTALVSLPLHSPHDGLLNTASVVLATLIVGVIAALIWRYLPDIQPRFWVYFGLMMFAAGKILIFVCIANIWVERTVSFAVPLTILAFTIASIGIPVLVKFDRLVRWQLVIPALLIALTIGAVFAGNGDQESGRLELPSRFSSIGPSGYF